MAVACAAMAHASPSFSTRRLQAIASATGISLPDAPAADCVNDSTWKYKGKALTVRTDAYGDISHIGYKLFDNRIAADYGTSGLLRFIERYALELDLKLDKHDADTRMAIDKIACTQGNASMLKLITPDTPFDIEEIERRMYRIKWNIGGKTLSLTIPADYQLISGADAVELEDIFERNIKRAATTVPDNAIDAWNDSKTYRSGSQLIAAGGEYLSKMIRRDLYINEKNGVRTVVIDRKRPVQTITNILLTGIYERELPMRLTLDRYGYKSTESEVTLQQFVNLCNAEGCTLYAGIKTHDSKAVSATVFALNTKFAYNHVLTVKFPLSILDGGNEPVEAVVYTYVPLQNVTEKFFTQDLQETKQ